MPKKNPGRRHRLAGHCLGAIVLVSVVPGTVRAQDAGSTATSELEGIVVTAERREARLVDTPLSVSFLSSNELKTAAVTNFLDLPTLVAGLRMDQLGSNTQPTIRGISNELTGVGVSATVATYLDGYYIPSQNGTSFDLPDVANIQVLKGPQGTLFGRNATGGAILVTTEQPDFTTRGNFSAGYGSYGENLVNGFDTCGMKEKVAVRIGSCYRDTYGWTKNIVTGKHDGFYDSYFVSPKLLIEPSSDVSFLLTYRRTQVNDPYGQVYRTVDGNSVGSFIPGAIVATDRFRDSADLPPRNLTVSDMVNLTTKVNLGFAKLTSLTGYVSETNTQRVDLDGSNLDIANAEIGDHSKTFTEELTLSNSTGPLSWTVGIYYFNDKGTVDYFYVDDYTAVAPVNLIYDHLNTQAYSAFADTTYNFAPDWFLTTGLRYSIEHKSFDYSVPMSPWTYEDDTWRRPTPRVVLRRALDSPSSVYASFSQASTTAPYNSLIPPPHPMTPQRAHAS